MNLNREEFELTMSYELPVPCCSDDADQTNVSRRFAFCGKHYTRFCRRLKDAGDAKDRQNEAAAVGAATTTQQPSVDVMAAVSSSKCIGFWPD